jgi:hypothetical protein
MRKQNEPKRGENEPKERGTEIKGRKERLETGREIRNKNKTKPRRQGGPLVNETEKKKRKN